MDPSRPHPLSGKLVVELAGLAPGPFCGMLLADYGASVLRIDGPRSPKGDVLARNKSSICIDLKHPPSRKVLLSILSRADVLIDPFRPGVLERLGLSPTEVLLKANARLVVARLTGFRRDGKYQDMAGHDINYLAVSGVLAMLGRAGENPFPPANILGDFAGGGAMCVVGILLALVSRDATGLGQVVEANMVDGSAYLATMPRLATKTPFWGSPRGENVLDGGCPWYATYRTKDPGGKYMAVGALEPHFYEVLVRGLGLDKTDLPPREDRANWPRLRALFEAKFAERTRSEWAEVFDGTDACVTPVLEQGELEKAGFEQRLPVNLGATPGKPILPGQGDWTGGTLAKGHGGEEILRRWIGWERGVDYHVEENSGILVACSREKL
ncbi:Isopenicillin N epimerase component-like protein [Hapsidospora chrysogenum ATCC 11550]|uniref:Isopenicillin N epimerase component-like protein n=1 Tax=Hapsidospora chrysogenum (strain ATCC 11550 / CBS 779.69 / DSM 880 / IAM 14645 / JCM 23072 / IMI 49137) TaxID=857340 RepID=A0A086TGU9_HAPC1|nr:Isopenicillin N epimerase component-like protein [Hapsidospora chrysogenum ATCC 11550]